MQSFKFTLIDVLVMAGARHGRRAFLTAAAAVGGGLASVGRASATDTDDLKNTCSRRNEGKEEQTLPIDPIDRPW